jgi:hypothetical protein
MVNQAYITFPDLREFESTISSTRDVWPCCRVKSRHGSKNLHTSRSRPYTDTVIFMAIGFHDISLEIPIDEVCFNKHCELVQAHQFFFWTRSLHLWRKCRSMEIPISTSQR